MTTLIAQEFAGETNKGSTNNDQVSIPGGDRKPKAKPQPSAPNQSEDAGRTST